MVFKDGWGKIMKMGQNKSFLWMYCLEKGPITFWGIRNNTGSWGIIPGHAKNNHFTRVPLGNGLASQSGK